MLKVGPVVPHVHATDWYVPTGLACHICVFAAPPSSSSRLVTCQGYSKLPTHVCSCVWVALCGQHLKGLVTKENEEKTSNCHKICYTYPILVIQKATLYEHS